MKTTLIKQEFLKVEIIWYSAVSVMFSVGFSNRNTAFEKYKFTKYVIILSFIWLWLRIPTWSAFLGEKISLKLFILCLEHFNKIGDWKIIEISLKVNLSADILKNKIEPKFLWTCVETFQKFCLKFL